jgi:hypothetical protein
LFGKITADAQINKTRKKQKKEKPEAHNNFSSSFSWEEGDAGTRAAALHVASRKKNSAMFELGFKVSN